MCCLGPDAGATVTRCSSHPQCSFGNSGLVTWTDRPPGSLRAAASASSSAACLPPCLVQCRVTPAARALSGWVGEPAASCGPGGLDGLPLVLSRPAPGPVVCRRFLGVCLIPGGSGSGSRGGLSQTYDLSQVRGGGVICSRFGGGGGGLSQVSGVCPRHRICLRFQEVCPRSREVCSRFWWGYPRSQGSGELSQVPGERGAVPGSGGGGCPRLWGACFKSGGGGLRVHLSCRLCGRKRLTLGLPCPATARG